MDWAVERVIGTCQERGSLEVKSSLRTAPSFARGFLACQITKTILA